MICVFCMRVSRCGDVAVFPQDSFYLVNWRSWHWLFKVQWISSLEC